MVGKTSFDVLSAPECREEPKFPESLSYTGISPYYSASKIPVTTNLTEKLSRKFYDSSGEVR